MTQSDQSSTPARNIWLIMFSCFMILYQILWISRVLTSSDRLQEQLKLNIPLEIANSILFVSLFTLGLRALIVRADYAVRYTIGVFVGLIGVTVLRLMLFAQADYDRQRLLFLVLFIGIVSCLFVLPYLLRQLHKQIKGDKSV